MFNNCLWKTESYIRLLCCCCKHALNSSNCASNKESKGPAFRFIKGIAMSSDEEDVKAIARLFADMGDSYVELIANGSEESMLIVRALLDVASHPEYDIASMTFNFWHSLQVILTKRDSYISFGNEASAEAERNRRLQVFCPAYESLVSLESVSMIPLTAVAEVERSRFLQAMSDAASGADVNALMVPVEELSDVCRRNRTVQEIVQGALNPRELNTVTVS
ncbi:hypothetical protein QYF36_022806 [Acer negundo]|nr:hypothetical protein QYF36_022806 [Acer negundo]